jgi:hypothetical protein
MNNAQCFCDLAYAALSREERELAELAGQPPKDPMSVCGIDEVVIHFLIRKEALRQKIPLGCEWPYSAGREKADFCLLDDAGRPVASFEMKLVTADPPEALEYWPKVWEDVSKHFHPEKGIKGACVSHERYNVLVVTNKDEARAEVERIVEKEIGRVVNGPTLFTSDSIKLNRLKGTNRNIEKWNYMRVVVFSGRFVPAS